MQLKAVIQRSSFFFNFVQNMIWSAKQNDQISSFWLFSFTLNLVTACYLFDWNNISTMDDWTKHHQVSSSNKINEIRIVKKITNNINNTHQTLIKPVQEVSTKTKLNTMQRTLQRKAIRIVKNRYLKTYQLFWLISGLWK